MFHAAAQRGRWMGVQGGLLPCQVQGSALASRHERSTRRVRRLCLGGWLQISSVADICMTTACLSLALKGLVGHYGMA